MYTRAYVSVCLDTAVIHIPYRLYIIQYDHIE